MKTASVLVMMTISFLAVPGTSTAQAASAEVTIKVPVNLTSFGPDVAKVRVACTINSDAITNGTGGGNHYMRKEQELPISGGQVTTNVSLVFSFTQLDNPVGKTAYLNCTLDGWSTSAQNWLLFVSNQANSSFKTSSGGDLSGAIGSPFVW
jgi:hypothetical protein